MRKPTPVTPTSIAVFARAPVPGEAKTRLIPRLGATGAARLQEMLIRRALRTAVASGVGPVSLWCWPDCAHPLFHACRDAFDVQSYAQRGDDLGARMLAAFATICTAGHGLLIGTDCPALTPADLRSASDVLIDGSDATLIAAEDGGYVLIGLRRAVPPLFEHMPWGSEHVTVETRKRLQTCGLRWRELRPSWDVDRPEDFDRLSTSGIMPEIDTLRRSAQRPC